MSVDICGVRLKNPVMTASGTFGSGAEFEEFFDLNRLGAVVTKGVASVPWPGNPTPRICETASGMLNAIGLQNAGFDVFAKRDLKHLEEVLIPDGQSGCSADRSAAGAAQHIDAVGVTQHTDAAGAAQHTDAAGAAQHTDAAGAAQHIDAVGVTQHTDAAGAAQQSGASQSAGLNSAQHNPKNSEDCCAEQIGTKVVVNVCGHSEEEYIDCVEKLAGERRADLLEINISCPNVKEGGIAFGTDPKGVERITAAVCKVARQPVIMKLSPNVTDIAEIARAAEAGGAHALSMINTLTGMKIDVARRTFALANKTGGLSGPAIHPVAVRMVYQCAQAVKIPIIGMGGICTAEDALEMIMAGASAVSVGTVSFHDQTAALSVIDGIRDYMEQYHVEDIRELIGCVR